MSVKDFRSALGLSQPQLAGLLDVRQATLSAWESGKAVPSFDLPAELDSLYRAFLVDVAALRAGLTEMVDDDKPWIAAARFWAAHPDLSIPDYDTLAAIPVQRDWTLHDVEEDLETGVWSWTVVWDDDGEDDYRTGPGGEGVWVRVKDGSWRQTKGHLQFRFDGRTERTVRMSARRAMG